MWRVVDLLSLLMGKSCTKWKEIPLLSLASGDLALTLVFWEAADAWEQDPIPAIPAALTRNNSLTESSNVQTGLIISRGNRVWRRMRRCGLFCLQNLFAPQVRFKISLWNLDQTMLSTLIPSSQIVDISWNLQTACGTWFSIALRPNYHLAFEVYTPSTQCISIIY